MAQRRQRYRTVEAVEAGGKNRARGHSAVAGPALERDWSGDAFWILLDSQSGTHTEPDMRNVLVTQAASMLLEARGPARAVKTDASQRRPGQSSDCIMNTAETFMTLFKSDVGQTTSLSGHRPVMPKTERAVYKRDSTAPTNIWLRQPTVHREYSSLWLFANRPD
ncbi:hypothetical protein BCV70DRAFT_207618 [Testicularia cyperi]|uniref:Uncharacterized protein n=1 Tax=Testicularia cyperi TaxID=1882483 RepID=A0A317XM23_9BASI|nr:hypothetical protein BCV70DRAFT_207618 [Testicularia cyperi]